MQYIIISLVAFIGSGLTLFSGFGLSTLLIPAFGLFFPIDVTIALTAIVHFLNNAFKMSLLGRFADRNVVLRFGIPSVIAAFTGAYLLSSITGLHPLHQYTIGVKTFTIMPVKMIIGCLLIFFALFDIIPGLRNIQVSRKHLILGGFLSGFFGGVSGNQGMLRSAFLIRAELSKEAFIATGIMIACITDVSRLLVYSTQIFEKKNEFDYLLISAATLSAFAGAYLGNRFIRKINIAILQYFVGALLITFGILLIAGII